MTPVMTWGGFAMASAVVHEAREEAATTSARPRCWLRIPQFVAGLAICAVAVWLTVQVNLGLAPWDVLHSGLSQTSGVSFGAVVVGLGIVILAGSALLGVRPGVGTLINVVLMGFVIDGLLATPWLDGLATGSTA